MKRIKNFFEEYGFILFVYLFYLGIIGYAFLFNAIRSVYAWVMSHPCVKETLCALLFLEVCILFVLFLLTRVTQWFKLIVGVRIVNILLLMSITGTLIYSLVGTLFSFYSPIIRNIVGLILLLILLLYIAYIWGRNFTYFIYSPKHYILYLRSFKFDGQDQEIEDIIMNEDKRSSPILTIGSPKTFFSMTVGHTFYLPSSEWKYWVEYYISRAKKIILVIGDSNGVMCGNISPY